jgi:hypothetical protein
MVKGERTMMEIPLSQGKIAIVDDADYGWLSQWKWCAFRSEKELFYATRSESVGVGLNKQRHIRMHHAIIGKPSKGFVSDHINGNGLDNRRENLRHVTHRENCQNKHCSKSSRYPGVCWHKHEQKWMARIGVGGKSIFLGYFISEEDAAQKYKNMCVLVAEWLKTQKPQTMDKVYHDGSGHLMCPKCGFCLPCGDCKKWGCGWLTAQTIKENKDGH